MISIFNLLSRKRKPKSDVHQICNLTNLIRRHFNHNKLTVAVGNSIQKSTSAHLSHARLADESAEVGAVGGVRLEMVTDVLDLLAPISCAGTVAGGVDMSDIWSIFNIRQNSYGVRHHSASQNSSIR